MTTIFNVDTDRGHDSLGRILLVWKIFLTDEKFPFNRNLVFCLKFANIKVLIENIFFIFLKVSLVCRKLIFVAVIQVKYKKDVLLP
jgi:hypothetical protein